MYRLRVLDFEREFGSLNELKENLLKSSMSHRLIHEIHESVENALHGTKFPSGKIVYIPITFAVEIHP